MTVVAAGLDRRIRERLEQLRDRFVAVSLRSRSVRLRRTSRSGAFDLWRLRDHDTDALANLLATLGREGAAPTRLCAVRGGEHTELVEDIVHLARASRQERMETGADILAVGGPILEGVCSDGTWLRAPVVLFPVSLQKTSTGRLGWEVAPRGAPELNEPLVQTLERLEGIRLDRSELLELDADGELGVDAETWGALQAYLTRIGLALESTDALPDLAPFPPRTPDDIEEMGGTDAGSFRLHHHLLLGRFPLSASSIILDYDQLLDPERRGLTDDDLGLARDLLLVDESEVAASDLREDGSDDTHPSSDIGEERPAILGDLRRWQVLPSDSSQDAVFSHLESLAPEAGDERGVVVQGPPGTGKSQLIANLIASSVAQGKRVLLVCPKRAALDVVANRLADLGLSEPVAVVHDVQRDRAAIGAAIAQTLEQAVSASEFDAANLDHQLASAAADHNRAMSRLDARVAAAQETYDCLTGRNSPRPGLAELLERALGDDGRELPNLSEFADEITPQAVDRHLPLVESMAAETHTLAAPHPLAERGDWSDLDGDALDAVFTRCEHIDDILATFDKLSGPLTPAQAHRREDLWREAAPLIDLFDEGSAAEIADFALFWGWTGGEAATGQWHQVMETLRHARSSLSAVPYQLINTSVDQLEQWREDLARLAELTSRWYRGFTLQFWRLRNVPRDILEHCAEPDSASQLPVDVGRLVAHALEWHAFLEALPSDNPLFQFGFDGQPVAIDDAIATLESQHRRVMCTHRLHEELQELGPAYAELPQLDALAAADLAGEAFFSAAGADRKKATLLAELDELLAEAEDVLGPGLRRRIRRHTAAGEFDAARDAVAAFVDARPDVAEAARQDRILSDRPAWLIDFLRRWRPGERELSEVTADLRLAVQRAWIDHWLDGKTVHSVEAPLIDEEQRARLSAALADCRAVADRGIIARFYGRLVEAFTDKPAARRAMRKLDTDARRKRYRKTLRQLVSEYWDNALSLVRPVWCCSPESVAAIFPLRPGLFDLVIFDEASQCPVESALPALLRARSAVVAGDDQQMPPSHFFQAATEPSDDATDSSLLTSVSVLALARAVYPGVTLRWHYRSHHEELVAFSNAAFYEGRLVTAPSSEPAISADIEGLHFELVDGLWQENQNPTEATRIVELVDRVLGIDGPDGRPPTVGVVTFNRKQAELVEQLLDERSAGNRNFARRLARDRQRPVVDQLFVRNLENVQGDERDIILMSPGYGPTEEAGPIHARFGPLNLAGGEKRLNVAITRARLGLWLVTSIDPDQLDVSATTHPGPRIFKAYLSFVRARSSGNLDTARSALDDARELVSGHRSLADASRLVRASQLGSRVADELAGALDRRGLQVRREVGLGSQHIDLAIRADADQRWQVGVDCREFLRQPDPLARDVYNPAFWRRQGWSIVRVSPGMWLECPDEVIDRLIRRVRTI